MISFDDSLNSLSLVKINLILVNKIEKSFLIQINIDLRKIIKKIFI